MTQDQKAALESKHAKYVGKTLKKEGEKDGKPWRLWELQFDVGGQYPWKVKSFDSLSSKSPEYLQLSSLQEGQYYEVVYKTDEYHHPQYGLQKPRTAIIIKASDKSRAESIAQLGGSGSEKVLAPPTPSADSWASFAKDYDSAMGSNPQKSSLHMVGCWIVNNAADAHKDVIERCKEHFNK